MYNLDKKTGITATIKGTIKLGDNAGDFDSVFPREIFTGWFDAIREKQKTGSVRVPRCR